MLRKLQQNNQSASILQQNLFIVLLSSEMIALAHVFSIIHVTICIPFHYLAGMMHEFSKYGWGAADMTRVVDTLYEALKKIRKIKTN